MQHLLRAGLTLVFTCCPGPPPAAGVISVVDDAGVTITLDRPAGRIISLAPNLTELLYTAGAGTKIVGTVRYSDYPQAAETIPRIGDAFSIDLEAVIGLSPDLIIAWETGTGENTLRGFIELGLTVYRSEPDSLEGIASTIQRFGVLGGDETTANRESRRFREAVESLRRRYGDKRGVEVFYQFWNRPLYTVNGSHLISRVIDLCGGRNVFSGLPALTASIAAEAVLEADPTVIIASGENDSRPDWLDAWRSWPDMEAVKNNQLYFIPPDLIQRHTSRILLGAEMMCKYIDRARNPITAPQVQPG